MDKSKSDVNSVIKIYKRKYIKRYNQVLLPYKQKISAFTVFNVKSHEFNSFVNLGDDPLTVLVC